MSVLKAFDQLSFKKLFWLALIVGVGLTIPLTVILIQQDTKLFSKADFKPPSSPVFNRGPAPTQTVKIRTIEPFLGKEGDIVVVTGSNFGFFPKKAYIQVGVLKIPEDHIVAWDDNKISFYLPSAAKSGDITIYNGHSLTNWPKILTVYSTSTKTKVIREENSLLIANANNVGRIVYYDSAGERYEKTISPPLTNQSSPTAVVNDLNNRKVAWVTLFDSQNIVIPFYVSPEDFGF